MSGAPVTRDITETFMVLRGAFRERDAPKSPAGGASAEGKGAAEGGAGSANGGGGAAAPPIAPLERGLYDALGDTGMHVQGGVHARAAREAGR